MRITLNELRKIIRKMVNESVSDGIEISWQQLAKEDPYAYSEAMHLLRGTGETPGSVMLLSWVDSANPATTGAYQIRSHNSAGVWDFDGENWMESMDEPALDDDAEEGICPVCGTPGSGELPEECENCGTPDDF